MNANVPAPLTYAQRQKPFAREVTFRIDPQHLFVDSGRKEERIPYAQIAQVRLIYEPKNFTSQGFRARFITKTGKTVSMTNLNWKTYFEFQQQAEEYNAFVAEVIRRAAKANPRLVCIGGRAVAIWFLSALLGVITSAAMVVGVVFAVMNNAWLYGVCAMILAIPFARLSYQLFQRNKPMLFSPDHLPERLLPDVPT